jgi:hypothetical protein
MKYGAPLPVTEEVTAGIPNFGERKEVCEQDDRTIASSAIASLFAHD